MSTSSNIRAGAAYVELYTQDNRLIRGLTGARKKLMAFSASVTTIGRKMLAASLIMATPFVAGVKVFADFEEQMANVSTMLDEPEKHMDRLTRGVRKMSIHFGEGTGTLAKGLYDILSASIPAEKALNVLAVSAKAAKAGVTDTGIAADAITTILNAYGLSADKAADVSDWLFQVVRRGKTVFGELAPSIGLVATTAASAGVGLDEFGAAIATMTRRGIKTENAITALNAIIATFLKPTDEAAKYAKTLGFELSSATIKSKGLKGVFEKIAKLPPDAISTLFPNKRAIRGVLPALQSMEGFNDDIKIMKNRAGAADKAYAKMAKTLSMSLARLKQAGIAILSVVGEALSKPIKKLSKMMIGMAKNVSKWIKKNKRVVVSIVAIIGVAGVAGAALLTFGMIAKVLAITFGILSGIVTILGATIGVLGSILAAVISPIGLATVAIAGLGAAILYYSGIGGKALAWLAEKFQILREFATKSWKGIADALVAGNFQLASKVLWSSLKVAWQAGISELQKYWTKFSAWYQETTAKVFYGTVSIINNAWAQLKTSWVNTVSFLSDVWNMFLSNLQKAWNVSQSWLQKSWLKFMGIFDKNLDVEAAIKLVDDELKIKDSEAQGQLSNALKDSAAKSNMDKAGIEADRKSMRDMIGNNLVGDLGQIEAESAKSLKESLEELKKAKAEWDSAIKEAKVAGRKRSKKGNSLDDIKKKLEGVPNVLDAVRGKIEIAGSFYADSARALSSGNAAERTAKATEDIKKNTKKTNQILQNQSTGLVFE
jgi:TP901 family phage tail tape measure protein